MDNTSGADAVITFFTGIIVLFVGAWIVSATSGTIEFLPELSYWESVLVIICANILFKK